MGADIYFTVDTDEGKKENYFRDPYNKWSLAQALGLSYSDFKIETSDKMFELMWEKISEMLFEYEELSCNEALDKVVNILIEKMKVSESSVPFFRQLEKEIKKIPGAEITDYGTEEEYREFTKERIIKIGFYHYKNGKTIGWSV